jgi:4-alpha-glucanotransferase
MRWERDWHAPGAPFLDPPAYPPLSAAMTGTHDTEPLIVWWEELPIDDRRALLAIPALAARGLDPQADWSLALRDALIALAIDAGSDEVFLPMQDVFGWPDRVNKPGTVGDQNWTWRLPWPAEELSSRPDALERSRFLRAAAVGAGRLRASD